MSNSIRVLFFAVLLFGCGGDEIGSSTLSVAWTFEEGDCTSNSVDKVSVAITPGDTSEFACSDGEGEVGEITAGGSYAIDAQGLDADGVVRFENFGQSASFPDGRTIGPVGVLLRPKSSSVTVTWNGCPQGFVLPYFITLYNPPAMAGGDLTDKVSEMQTGCDNGEVVLENVAPGDYIAEVDSRAISPMILGTAEVTVVAGEDAEVNVPVP